MDGNYIERNILDGSFFDLNSIRLFVRIFTTGIVGTLICFCIHRKKKAIMAFHRICLFLYFFSLYLFRFSFEVFILTILGCVSEPYRNTDEIKNDK